MKTNVHIYYSTIAIYVFIIFQLSSKAFAQPRTQYGKLSNSATNPHYLAYQDGTPFLWFADTAWELIHRLNRQEAEEYLENRRIKGFNVIQAVAISEFHHRKQTNYYGDSLFKSNNPLEPVLTHGNRPDNDREYDYWDHVEYIVKLAQQKGLYIALLPSWGEWIIPRENKALFNTTQQTYQYGWFIANRLKGYPNIIWVLGGDRRPEERKNGVELWRGMAEGIADATNNEKKQDGKANYTTTLMTHHSFQTSAAWFATDPWIDFHMWGSYHSDFYLSRAYEQTASDRNLPNPKPTINGEPSYEDHPVNFALQGNGVFTEVDVRISAYWTMFSGAGGYSYGAHPIWQFADSLRPKYSELTFRPWQQALDLPGSSQVIQLKKLMESRPLKDLTPDQSMITAGQGTGGNYACAIRGVSHAFIYIPTGNKLEVKLGTLTGESIKAWWFNPRTGSGQMIGTYPNTGQISFDVPGMSEQLKWLRSGRGCDWVLVLDDASRNYPLP